MSQSWEIKIPSHKCPFAEKTRKSNEYYQCFSMNRKEVDVLCQEWNCPIKTTILEIL